MFEFRRSAARASAFVRRTLREVKTFQSALTRLPTERVIPHVGVIPGILMADGTHIRVAVASSFLLRNANPDFVKTDCSRTVTGMAGGESISP